MSGEALLSTRGTTADVARRSVEAFCCAPGETRTPNLLIRSQMLYPLSYGCLSDHADNEERV